MRLHVHLHSDPWVTRLLHQLTRGQEFIMAALDELKTEVTETKTVQESAVALLNGLKTKLDEALASGNVEAEVKTLRDELDASNTALADAISRNTPAEGGQPQP